jgi:hypothetical protein
MRFVLAIAVALVATLSPNGADACSCVKRSFADHAKAEKQVFLARAGKPVKTGDALKQTFTVLATFKGPAQAQFVHDRPATPPCATSHADGEVAIVFTTGGEVDPCHGNLPLAAVASALPEILTATGTKRDAAKTDAVQAALRVALAKYTHDYAKTGTAKDVDIATAFTAGNFTFVEGTYGTEGLRFTVILHFDKTWKPVWSSVAET